MWKWRLKIENFFQTSFFPKILEFSLILLNFTLQTTSNRPKIRSNRRKRMSSVKWLNFHCPTFFGCWGNGYQISENSGFSCTKIFLAYFRVAISSNATTGVSNMVNSYLVIVPRGWGSIARSRAQIPLRLCFLLLQKVPFIFRRFQRRKTLFAIPKAPLVLFRRCENFELLRKHRTYYILISYTLIVQMFLQMSFTLNGSFWQSKPTKTSLLLTGVTKFSLKSKSLRLEAERESEILWNLNNFLIPHGSK